MPHPAAQIIVWMSLAFLAQRLQPLTLTFFSLLLLALALHTCAGQFMKLLKRTRWILFSLLLIYAYSTPGAALVGTWGVYAPTWEGLQDGVVQLERLLALLSGLAILLSMLDREQLIGGIYALAYPLRWLGISRERAAVRLALTLQYAEAAMGETAADWRGTVVRALGYGTGMASQIEVRQPAWRGIDIVCLLSSLLIVLLGLQ